MVGQLLVLTSFDKYMGRYEPADDMPGIWHAYICYQQGTKTKITHIPPPFISWVSFADVDNEKICHIFKISNNLAEVVHEIDEKWRSGIAAEVDNQWPATPGEIQQSALFPVSRNYLAVWSRSAKSSRPLYIAQYYL